VEQAAHSLADPIAIERSVLRQPAQIDQGVELGATEDDSVNREAGTKATKIGALTLTVTLTPTIDVQ
jgi:hypothetical protein